MTRLIFQRPLSLWTNCEQMNVYIGKAEVSVLQLHVPAHSECQIKCIYSEKSRTFLSLKYV